ncbi:cupin domain-containing protein [Nocardioides carbamazepini]|uniref:cupin domain-containing protein n=1 Tax=Nocardioides carbamazepini TaxID=2854259 RepID=UPI00214A7FB6|nr:cupin domain-containing protein [Nocardioides carbamazepini]MCR1782358.1 cupin domain-containing protein [Nocardioides carbamazepini]
MREPIDQPQPDPVALLPDREADFAARLQDQSMRALWHVLADVMTENPVQPAVPHLWRWRDVAPLVNEAGDLVTAEEADRRALMLINPGLAHLPASTTATLFAGIQSVLPGEIAPAHRHTPSALRFVIAGEGAYTGVAGNEMRVSPGDLVLTPNWSWHDHGNDTSEPVVWLDCLDTPLVLMLNAVFYQRHEQVRHPVTTDAQMSWERWASGMRPVGQTHDAYGSPILSYPWAKARATLHALRDEPVSPYDGVILEYLNPADGGSVLPTSSAYLQLLRPGQRTWAHRHVSSAIYHVAEGRGSTTIDGQTYDWAEGDSFVVPGWSWHQHNAGSGEAVLFSYTDAATMRKLGLERTEERTDERTTGDSR